MPFTDTLDTTTATTAGSDPVHSCSGQSDSKSVWYSFTPGSSGTVLVDTTGTTYRSVVTVYTGSCGALTEVVCKFPAPSFSLTATGGATYLIEVTDCTGCDGGAGGTLHLALNFLNWRFIEAPNGDTGLDKIRIDPYDDSLWYVGSGTNGLYITRDGGSTWENHLSGLTCGLFIDPTSPDRIYAGSWTRSASNNLFRSDDKGQTWSLIKSFPTDQTIYSILVSSIDSSVFVGMHWGASTSTNGIYKSTDHGQSWTFYPFNIPPLPYNQNSGLITWDIAEDPLNRILYVATEVATKPPCFPSCYDPPTLRSRDGGQTWQDVSGNLGSPGSLPWHATRIQVDPDTGYVYFQVEGGTVYISANFGDSWGPLGTSYSWDLVIDANYPTRFFGGSLYGFVALSADTARSFVDVGPPGLFSGSYSFKGLFHVALNSTSTKLYASYEPQAGSGLPGGVYVADLPGSIPPFRVASTRLTGGNGNQTVEANECNDLALVIHRNGNSAATSVSATLSTTTPGVSIIQPHSTYPDVAAGATYIRRENV